ncbi:MAG: cytochrome c oxidase subunit II [Bacteriovoracaceae bacterium]
MSNYLSQIMDTALFKMTGFLVEGAAQVGEKFSGSLWSRMLPPEDISANGHLIDWLFGYTTYMNIFFFALVCLGLFGFSYLYSAKKHPKPEYTYGNKKVHITIATVIGAAVFFCIDSYISTKSSIDYTEVFINWPEEDKEPVERIEVMAQQWAWNFRYAGKDGVFNTEDDVITFNDLKVPTHKKVVFQVISKDVIHALYLPNTRRKVDAIPGRITRMWIDFVKTGTFDLACAEMCGTYHYRMQAKYTAMNEADYNAWMKEAQERAFEDNDPEDPDLYWGWKWQPNLSKESRERLSSTTL